MAQIIDGNKLSEKLRAQIKSGVEELKKTRGIQPGLAVVLVGENEASKIYIRNKTKACEKLGIQSIQHKLPEDTEQKILAHLIEQLNHDPHVHGILVQLPLPKHLEGFDVTTAIDPKKDVDGFHPQNLGNLVTGRPGFLSCTPFGIMKMLEEIHYHLEGKDAVVIGRSNIVGKPMGMMLLAKNATVTYCHSKTKNIAERVKAADVVVAALGRAEFVKGDWIKPGAVVIDVGINRTKEGKLLGDVEFGKASAHASYITPVPGGVGPMTITMLMWNTLESAKKFAEMK
jgi:methylenetetrahydrofolate dehydrogenase (NADP+) / methenyltetrahydrofolate cyclohydrolase